MNLKDTIEINKRIMKLIKRKYDEAFPAGHNTLESRYYEHLDLDTRDAESFLGTPEKK